VYDRATGEEEVESVQDLEKTVKKSRPKFSFEAVAKREKRWFRAHMVHWRSFRLRRVTRSTFGSETLAMVESMDSALVVREVFSQILGRRLKVRLWTDCKSLVDALETMTMPLEKRLQVDLASLRETCRDRDVDGVGWVEASRNYSDALTKNMDVVAIRDYMARGELIHPRPLMARGELIHPRPLMAVIDGISFGSATKRTQLRQFA
jgi:hypothetical protein